MLQLPNVIGHRGAMAYAPENTLESFREARRRGATWVEIDVKLTADGVPIVMHDSSLKRTTGVDRLASEMRASELPPTPYARQGGEIVASMLDKVGIKVKLENVEWAQWLSGVYKERAYDLTVIAHVEPLDFGNFARPNYYWGYESPKFNALWDKIQATGDAGERNKLMGEAQRLVAEDAVAAYLYQPTWITVANARLKGLWKEVPLFANDIAAMSWQ